MTRRNSFESSPSKTRSAKSPERFLLAKGMSTRRMKGKKLLVRAGTDSRVASGTPGLRAGSLRTASQMYLRELLEAGRPFAVSSTFQQKEAVLPGNVGYDRALIPNTPKRFGKDERIRMIPNTHYGRVRFYESEKPARPFVTLADDSHPGKIRYMMEKEWNLQPPGLLISVTGGAQAFKSRDLRLEETFRRAMIRTAVSTKAWIITGGSDDGVMALVGKAVDEVGMLESLPVIGVATWGVITHQDSFKREDDVEDFIPNMFRKMKANGRENTAPDGNHTHFVFVDDGSKGKWGGEIELRAKIELAIQHPTHAWKEHTDRHAAGTSRWSIAETEHGHADDFAEPAGSRATVPGVLLCYEGGPGTSTTIYEKMYEHDNVVVVVNGSGRICDVFAYAYKHWQQVATAARKKRGTIDLAHREKELENVHGGLHAEDLENLEDVLEEVQGHLDVDIRVFRDIERKELEIRQLTAAGSEGLKRPLELRNIQTAAQEHAAVRLKQAKAEKFELESSGCRAVELFYTKVMGQLDEQKVKEVMYCARQKDAKGRPKLSVIEKDDTIEQMEEKILYAILKGQALTLVQQLRMCINWNNVKSAEKFVLQYLSDGGHSEADIVRALGSALHYALQQNSVDFIRLLLDNGADIHLVDLNELYKSSLHEQDGAGESLSYLKRSPFFLVRHSEQGPSRRQLPLKASPSLRSRTLGSLTKKSMHTESDLETWYRREDPLCPANKAIERAVGCSLATHTGGHQTATCTFEDAFLWCALCGRFDMARVLWEQVNDPLLYAVAGANLFQAVADKCDDSSKDKMQTFSDQFEQISVNLLDICHKANLQRTQEVVDAKLVSGGTMNIIEIAAQGYNNKFVAAQASQTLLKRQIMGDLEDETWEMLVCLAILVPPLVYTLPFRRDSPVEGFIDRYLAFIHTPITKFYLKFLAYFIFTIVFSIVVLSPFAEMDAALEKDEFGNIDFNYGSTVAKVSTVEGLFLTYMAVHTMQELSDIMVDTFSVWASNIWNKLDGMMMCCFLMYLPYRFVVFDPIWARIFLSVGSLVAWLRLLDISRVSQDLGMIVQAFIQMFKDIKIFLVIMIIFLIGFAVAGGGLAKPFGFAHFEEAISTATSNNGREEQYTDFVLDLLKYPLWRVFGDTKEKEFECAASAFDFDANYFDLLNSTDGDFRRMLKAKASSSSGFSSGAKYVKIGQSHSSSVPVVWDSSLGPQTCAYPIKDVYSSGTYVARLISLLFAAIYMIFTNVILVNLLIAIMNDTYTSAKEHAQEIFRMNQYKLVQEFPLGPMIYAQEFSLFALMLPGGWFSAGEFVYTSFKACCKGMKTRKVANKEERTKEYWREQGERKKLRYFTKDCQLKLLREANDERQNKVETMIKDAQDDTKASRKLNKRMEQMLKLMDSRQQQTELKLQAMQEQMTQIHGLLARMASDPKDS